MQSVVMLGRLCADPELRHTASGVAYCQWRLAVDRDYRDGAGERQSDFFQCRAWRGTAEHIARWWHKGQRILCEGHMETRTYTDRDGVRRYGVDYCVERVHFVGDVTARLGNAFESLQLPENDGGDLPF